MRIYRTAAGLFAGTQDAAGKGFVLVNFPETKPEILAFLNQLVAPPDPPLEAELPEPEPEAPAEPVATLVPPAPPPGQVDALVDWIVDDAQQRDIERLFEALGTRFGETLRARRAA